MHTHTHTHTSLQYIRQLMDCHGVYNLGKPNTFSVVEDLTLFAALPSNIGTTTIAPRLQRHFAIIHLPELVDTPLTTILTETLRTYCGGLAETKAGTQGSSISADALSSIVQSTATVFLQVRDALRESNMPGRQHYVFSLSHIESAFQVNRVRFIT